MREERYEVARNFVRMYGLTRLPPPLLGYALEMGRGWMDGIRPKRKGAAMFNAYPMLQWPPMMPPFPFMPGADQQGNGMEMPEIDGSGLIVPEPLNSLMRLLFGASAVGDDHEK